MIPFFANLEGLENTQISLFSPSIFLPRKHGSESKTFFQVYKSSMWPVSVSCSVSFKILHNAPVVTYSLLIHAVVKSRR